jgi:hypothetical protein
LRKDGIKYYMKNKAALKLLYLLFVREVELVDNNYVRLKFTFTKTGTRYFINPRKL